MVVLPCTAHAAILHGTHYCTLHRPHVVQLMLHPDVASRPSPVAFFEPVACFTACCNNTLYITAGATTTAHGLSLTAERARRCSAKWTAWGEPSPARVQMCDRGEPKSVPVRMRGRGVLEYGVLERVPLPAVPYSGTLLGSRGSRSCRTHGYSRVLKGTHGYSRVRTGTHGYSIDPRGSRRRRGSLSVIYPRAAELRRPRVAPRSAAQREHRVSPA
jgi:hypothetical protein